MVVAMTTLNGIYLHVFVGDKGIDGVSIFLGPFPERGSADTVQQRLAAHPRAIAEIVENPCNHNDVSVYPVDEAFIANESFVDAFTQVSRARTQQAAEAAAANPDSVPFDDWDDDEDEDEDENSATNGQPGEQVDWRTIFVKYRHFVSDYEGIDFLGHVGPNNEPFTPAEWDAMNRACAEDDRERARIQNARFGLS